MASHSSITQPRPAQDRRGFFVDFIPVASSLQTRSWRPRESRHSRAAACPLRGGRRLRWPRRRRQTYGLIFIIVVPRVVAQMKPHAWAEVHGYAGAMVVSAIADVVLNVTTVV
jgi:hypothetical protein